MTQHSDTTDGPRLSNAELRSYILRMEKHYGEQFELTIEFKVVSSLLNARAEIATLKREIETAREDEREKCAQLCEAHQLERPQGAEWGLMEDDERSAFYAAQREHERVAKSLAKDIRSRSPAAP